MTWLRTHVSSDENITEAQERFFRLMTAAGLPEHFAMLSRTDGLPAGDIWILLTPSAASSAAAILPGKVWEAIEAPPAAGTGVLVSNGDPIRALHLR